MITQITTHQDDALKRLMQQFKDKTNLKKLLNIYLPRFQELEDEIWQLLNRLDIDAVSGIWLDYIGEIVVLTRVSGTTDERYRQLLKAKIATNVSEGEPERIISIFKILTLSDWVHFGDNAGNVFLAGTAEYTDQDEINALFRDVDKALMAGVRMPWFVCADSDEAFMFDGPGDGLGFDDGTGTVGGEFAEHYEERIPFAFDGPDTNTAGFGAGADDPFVGGVFL